MNYHNITKDDMLNGEGLRVVLWVAGCEHHCPECQNQQTWDYNSGIPFDDEAYKELSEELRKDYIEGITFSGGDPLAPGNRYEIMNLICRIREEFPNKTIWLYTGFKFEQLILEKFSIIAIIVMILKNVDVIVDGRYDKDLRDINLKWRGSSNQRVIDVKKSLLERKVVLYCE